MIKIILIIEFSYTPKASFVFTSIALKREHLFPLGTKVLFLHCLQFIRSNEPSPYLTSPQISDSFNGCPQNLQPSISLFTTYPSSITRLPVNHNMFIIFITIFILQENIIVYFIFFLSIIMLMLMQIPWYMQSYNPFHFICFRELLWVEHTKIVCLKICIYSKKLCPKCVQFKKSNIIQVFL